MLRRAQFRKVVTVGDQHAGLVNRMPGAKNRTMSTQRYAEGDSAFPGHTAFGHGLIRAVAHQLHPVCTKLDQLTLEAPGGQLVITNLPTVHVLRVLINVARDKTMDG